jgi:hypothetical protein
VYWALYAESSTAHLGGIAGTRGLPNYLWYLNGPLRDAMGLLLEALALIGLFVAFSLRRRPQILLATFSLLFLFAIGLSVKRWDRWVVPLVPCVAFSPPSAWTRSHGHADLRMRPAVRTSLSWRSASCWSSFGDASVQAERPRTRATFQTVDRANIAQGRRSQEQYAPPISRDVSGIHRGEGCTAQGHQRRVQGVLGRHMRMHCENRPSVCVITSWSALPSQKETSRLVRSYELVCIQRSS